jgi:hypothetical protein
VTSIKKLGSRLSAIIPGCARSGAPGSVDKLISFSNASVKSSAASANNGSSTNDGVLLSSFTNNGMELHRSGFVGDGPHGHCIEDSEQQLDNTQQELHRELGMLRQTAIAVPPAFHAQLNEIHSQGQRIISLLTLIARRVNDAEATSRVTSLLETVGESLLVSLDVSVSYLLARFSPRNSYFPVSLGGADIRDALFLLPKFFVSGQC